MRNLTGTCFALAAAVLLALLLLSPAPAAAQGCSGIHRVEQAFPTAGPEETRWIVCWMPMKGPGLVITGAFFRKAPTSPWIRVLWDARVAEIFVPYHVPNQNDRFFDVGFGFDWVRLTATECLNGTLLGAGPHHNDICKLVRDRGLAWMDYASARRGEELVLWGAIGADNYNYITEWTFRDDGVIEGRVGSTAEVLPGAETTNHTHDVTWRLDLDVNGFANDSVDLMSHNVAGLNESDTVTNVASEAGLTWDPQHFHSLFIHDANLKNGQNHTTMYDLMPMRYGNQRHQETYSGNDLWVTLFNPTELRPRRLPSYINPPQNVHNADVVVWYTSAAHHFVRDEDEKETLLMWIGFMLKPHDLFDSTPLYP